MKRPAIERRVIEDLAHLQTEAEKRRHGDWSLTVELRQARKINLLIQEARVVLRELPDENEETHS
jgi:hypothetical protein